MITEQVKFYAGLALTVIATILLVLAVQHYVSLRNKAALADSRKTVIETTTAVLEDSAEAEEDRRTTDAGVNDARIIFVEGRNNDPISVDRRDRDVPAGLRDAYRERRLARERLARDGARDGERAGTEDAAER